MHFARSCVKNHVHCVTTWFNVILTLRNNSVIVFHDTLVYWREDSSFDLNGATKEDWKLNTCRIKWCGSFVSLLLYAYWVFTEMLQNSVFSFCCNFRWGDDVNFPFDSCRNFHSLSDASRYFWGNLFLSTRNLLFCLSSCCSLRGVWQPQLGLCIPRF